MGLAISAAALYICVFAFARAEAQESRWKILVLALGVAFANAALGQSGWPAVVILGGTFILLPIALAFLLVWWCKIERKAAMKSAASYMAALLAISVVARVIVAYAA